MTLATNCVEQTESDLQSLIDRLCRLDSRVVYFPVRHHSPAAADLVRELIDRIRPAHLLIEGPSDFNERWAELLLDHELPIAIYSYFQLVNPGAPNTPPIHRGAYYPFCDYSPEWIALRHAAVSQIPTRFIDLPFTTYEWHDQATHRYADAQLRRSGFVAELCERMQVEDFDDLWDKIIESDPNLTLEDYLQRVHSLCFQIRLWETEVSVADRQREAFMADQIREALKSADGPVLVVTGGFHSSALVGRVEGLSCPGIDDAPSVPTDSAGVNGTTALADVGLALTTYSYERLDSLVGYNAGMPSPGFYDESWRQRQTGMEFTHAPLARMLVTELRKRKQTLSTADLIAIETTARALASIRGRTRVWRSDLIDAVTSALIKDEVQYGCASPFIEAAHAVLRGDRRGKLAAGTKIPPLVADIQQQLQSTQLLPERVPRDVELDLLKHEELSQSRLLHRLQLLQIVGYKRIAGTDFLERSDLERLWERWQITWSPEFESSCIESSKYGTTLSDAVASRLAEIAGTLDRNAAPAAELLVQAALAGVDTISDSLLQRLSHLIDHETQFLSAVTAVRHLLFLFCFDEAFGTKRLPQVGRLLRDAFARSIWLLESLGGSSSVDRTTIEGLRTLLETVQRTSSILDLDRVEFLAVVRRVEGNPHQGPAIRGGAAGILWSMGVSDEAAVLADLKLFVNPSDLGDFLTGLFAVAREVAQRHTSLVRTIDQRLMEFDADHFQQSLPALRLAFTYFTPREKHFMLTTLFESLGLKEVQPLAELKVDAATAADALAFEERLFELIDKYQLEPSDE